MTNRDLVRSEPQSVQEVLKIIAVSISRDHEWGTDEQIDYWMGRAIEEWKAFVVSMDAPDLSEAALAEIVIEKLRAKTSWGKILRRGTS